MTQNKTLINSLQPRYVYSAFESVIRNNSVLMWCRYLNLFSYIAITTDKNSDFLCLQGWLRQAEEVWPFSCCDAQWLCTPWALSWALRFSVCSQGSQGSPLLGNLPVLAGWAALNNSATLTKAKCQLVF